MKVQHNVISITGFANAPIQVCMHVMQHSYLYMSKLKNFFTLINVFIFIYSIALDDET